VSGVSVQECKIEDGESHHIPLSVIYFLTPET